MRGCFAATASGRVWRQVDYAAVRAAATGLVEADRAAGPTIGDRQREAVGWIRRSLDAVGDIEDDADLSAAGLGPSIRISASGDHRCHPALRGSTASATVSVDCGFRGRIPELTGY